jgi:hypothetical protein
MATLERRLDTLETHRANHKTGAGMTDAELMSLYLTAHAGRRPSAAEVAAWLALPDDELRRRFSEPGQSR